VHCACVTCIQTAAVNFSEFPAFAGVPVALLASLLMLVSFVVGIAVLALVPTVVVAVASVPLWACFLAVAGVPAVDGVPAVCGVPAVYGVPVDDGVPVVGGVSVVIAVLLLLMFLKLRVSSLSVSTALSARAFMHSHVLNNKKRYALSNF